MDTVWYTRGLSYADDICLLTHTHTDMKLKLVNFSNGARASALVININKAICQSPSSLKYNAFMGGARHMNERLKKLE